MPLLQDALDSLEFLMGPTDSRWGALRAAMGHPEPWQLNYMAIGNEVGCGCCGRCGRCEVVRAVGFGRRVRERGRIFVLGTGVWFWGGLWSKCREEVRELICWVVRLKSGVWRVLHRSSGSGGMPFISICGCASSAPL